jgi:hypothetical protein
LSLGKALLYGRPCFSSGGLSLSSHHDSPGLSPYQIMWDFWWQSDTESNFLRLLLFPLPILIQPTVPNSNRRIKWFQSHKFHFMINCVWNCWSLFRFTCSRKLCWKIQIKIASGLWILAGQTSHRSTHVLHYPVKCGAFALSRSWKGQVREPCLAYRMSNPRPRCGQSSIWHLNMLHIFLKRNLLIVFKCMYTDCK